MLKPDHSLWAAANAAGSSGQGAGTLPSNTPEPLRLDPDAVARLRELDPTGENGLIERVLRAFEASVARLVPQLSQARSEGDMQTIRHVAHTLRSSSASIGALKLSRLCADIEVMARQSRSPAIEVHLDAMMAELSIVPDAFKTLLKTRS
jgi:HPt (histidine-containing phosphotransfer) domain-containing protein